MKDEQTLHLWEERFKKIIKLEVESKRAYEVLLKRYSHLLGGTRIQTMIRRIMRDEAHHITVARKLLDIVHKHRKALAKR